MQTPEILRYKHPLLTKVCRSVDVFDIPFIRWVSMFMWHSITMEELKGIGISANQIGLNTRFFVADGDSLFGKSYDGNLPYVTVCNPRVCKCSEETEVQKEGCMSIPGVQVPVRRPKWIEVEYMDDQGEPQSRRLEGLGARLFLHEYDHLEGVLIVDKPAGSTGMQVLKKSHILKKMKANAEVGREQLDEMGLDLHMEFLNKFRKANEKSAEISKKEDESKPSCPETQDS